jgi:integrase
MTPAFASSEVAKALLLLLTDTGARLAEITGLEAKDVDIGKAIRPNERRGPRPQPAASHCHRELQTASGWTLGYRPHLSPLCPTPGQ